MKDSKNLVIGLLCAVVCIMAVAYAAFATQLNVTGTATIAGSWKVNMLEPAECSTVVAGGKNGETTIGDKTLGMTVDVDDAGTRATFSATLLQPGDSVSCIVKVKNLGTIDAVVKSLDVKHDTESKAPITYTVDDTNIAVGQTLNSSVEKTFTITATYDSTVTQQPEELTKDLTIDIVYVDADTATN